MVAYVPRSCSAHCFNISLFGAKSLGKHISGLRLINSAAVILSQFLVHWVLNEYLASFAAVFFCIWLCYCVRTMMWIIQWKHYKLHCAVVTCVLQQVFRMKRIVKRGGFYRAALYATRSFWWASVRLSVRPSVCLSNAWIVTKRKHLAKKVQLWLIGSWPRAFQWA